MSGRTCESCGMPMRKTEDFGGKGISNNCCVYCCDEKGNLKTYEQVFEGMKGFAMKQMGISEKKAEEVTRENMAKMPAWQGR